VGRHPAADRRSAVLAAIARREWLLRMLALSAAAGCQQRDDPAYTRGNTLVMAYPEKYSLRYDDLAIQSLHLPRLVAQDENGDLQPLLAQSWEPSADYRECTYHLRTDVRWSDGVPVTAHDVKFTLDEFDRLYRALTEILRADLPVTRLVPWTNTTFAHRRVRGPSALLLAQPDRYMEDLWLETKP